MEATIIKVSKEEQLQKPEEISGPAANVETHALTSIASSHNRPSFLNSKLEDVQKN
jgi:hypothetical protein